MMAWECVNCGHTGKERPAVCKCGLIQEGEGTEQKYQILSDYCPALSLIMRNNRFNHYFIDACAGSGVVQRLNKNELGDGSPLIMAKTRERVEKRIVDKTREPSVKCIFIECEGKTYDILEKTLSPYSDFVKCIPGDCNELLPKILDDMKSAFAFVYIDPFGLGSPVISFETVKLILKRSFTELFIHFSWEGVSRTAGLLKNINHSNSVRRNKARTGIETLTKHLGEGWKEIWERTPDWKRKESILNFYISRLKEFYPNIQNVEIPVGSRNPSYYLIFTTRNRTASGIMKDIMTKLRRKGCPSIAQFKKRGLPPVIGGK